MNILSLVPEAQEIAFNAFIEKGICRIKGNREWCGMSLSSFFDWLYQNDNYHRMLCGLLRSTMVIDFAPQMSAHKLMELENYQKNFDELLEKYVRENNWQNVLKGYREHLAQVRESRAIDEFESKLRTINY